MKKHILSFLIVLCSTASIFSQSNFKEGYIISNLNDTVQGLIDFRTDDMNSLNCRFKKTTIDTAIDYWPDDIIAYRFKNEGKYYVSKTVKIDSIEHKYFLEFLVKGELNLYYLSKDYGYYFFEDTDGTMIEFTKKPDVITKDNRLMEDNRYKGVMTYVYRKSLALATKTSKFKFNRKSIIENTKKYHDEICETGESCIIFENDYKKKFNRFDLTAYSGIEFNKLNFNMYWPESLYETLSTNDMNSSSPLVGVELDFSNPRYLKSLHMIIDLNFTKLNAEYNYTKNEYVFGYEVTYKFKYLYSALKSNIGLGLKYIYDKGFIRPTIEIGYFTNFLINQNSQLIRVNTNNLIISTKILPQYNIGGLKGGMGLDFRINDNQYIITRFVYYKTINEVDNIDSKQLKIGYKIKL